MLSLTEIDETNWRDALAVEVRADQLPFVAEHQPVALVILAKCFVQPDGQEWTPYLAVDDGDPVGVLAVAHHGDHAHLRHVVVDHRRQGQGFGRWMLDAAISAVQSSRPACRYLQVTTHPENEIALALYRSAGFRLTGAFSGIEPVLVLDLVDAPTQA